MQNSHFHDHRPGGCSFCELKSAREQVQVNSEPISLERPIKESRTDGFTLGLVVIGVLLAFAAVATRRISKSKNRSGLTLIELLVTMSIISILIGLGLPAIQSARESARKTECSNNLRQLSIALLNYESQWKALPQGASFHSDGTPSKSWLSGMLPFMEGENIVNNYKEAYGPHSSENKSVVSTQVSLLKCPSSVAEEYSRIGNNMGSVSSYHPFSRISRLLIDKLMEKNYIKEMSGETPLGVRARDSLFKSTRLAEVSDGLSNTLVFVHADGGSFRWHDGHMHETRVVGSSAFDTRSPFTLDGLTYEGLSPGGIWNLSNGGGIPSFKDSLDSDLDKEPYAFHVGLNIIASLDGSVRSVSDSIDISVLVRLGSHNDQQVLSEF